MLLLAIKSEKKKRYTAKLFFPKGLQKLAATKLVYADDFRGKSSARKEIFENEFNPEKLKFALFFFRTLHVKIEKRNKIESQLEIKFLFARRLISPPPPEVVKKNI